jgi:internalin A
MAIGVALTTLSDKELGQRILDNISEAKKNHSLSLDLGNSGLTRLPKELAELPWLEKLILCDSYHNYLANDDEWNHFNTSNVGGRYNNIESIQPEILHKLVNLKELYINGRGQNLDKSELATLDLAPLEFLIKLETLDISSRKIKNLDAITKLVNLQRLEIGRIAIPSKVNLSKIRGLKILGAESINGQSLIEDLEDLENLEQLFIDGSEIIDFSFLKKFKHLRWLSCNNTQISDLSPLKDLVKLKLVTVTSSPIVNPPKEILVDGIEAVQNFFKQIEDQDGTVPLYEAKLIMVGEPGAGKTTLAEKLWDENHIVLSDDPHKKSTLGINVKPNWRFNDCKRPNEQFVSHIWDFGGQEIQYMTHQFFLTPDSLYVLVADDRKQHTLFPYWFEVIHLLGKDDGGHYSPIIVVLNERNHKSITNFDINEYRKKYPNTRIDVLEVDLSDAELDRFRTVRDKIQHSLCYLDHVGRPLPRTWSPIRHAILELSNSQNHMTEQEFADMCARFHVFRKEDRKLISTYLHRLGIILHFQSDISLANFIIINPTWALKAVYAILENKDVEKRNGEFSDADLDMYWKDLSIEERGKILGLMRKDSFEICYPVNDNSYIAPQLLPKIRPEFKWNSKESLKCHFFYRFMPKGIMTRLIVRKHQYLANDWQVWARGAMFRRFECDILVTEEETERNGLIAIEINGKAINRIRALNFIRNEVEEIHSKWFPNIPYEERAPCNCSDCLNAETPTFFSWEKLMQRLIQNRETIECDNINIKGVPVMPLLEGVYDHEYLKNNMFFDPRLYLGQGRYTNDLLTKREGFVQNSASKVVVDEEILESLVTESKGEKEKQRENESPNVLESNVGKKLEKRLKDKKMKNVYLVLGMLALAIFGYTIYKMFNSNRASEASLTQNSINVKVGEENINKKAEETVETTVTIIGSVKINSKNAWAEDVKNVRIKGQTLGGQNTLNSNGFILRDVNVKSDKIIEIVIDLRGKGDLSDSRMFKLPLPDKDKVSDVGEVLIEVKPPSSKSNGQGKASPALMIINNQYIQIN